MSYPSIDFISYEILLEVINGLVAILRVWVTGQNWSGLVSLKTLFVKILLFVFKLFRYDNKSYGVVQL